MNNQINEKMMYSISPSGQQYALPSEKDYRKEFDRIRLLVDNQKELGREIVVVMGLGFVGAAMAAVIANAEDNSGKPSKFVIGLQRPSVRSFWKIQMINEGISPLKASDPKVQQYINSCVREKKTLIATYTDEVLKLANTIIVDIQCDYHKEVFGDIEKGYVEIDNLKEALHTVGTFIPPKSLVLIETTVPPGTTEHIAYPIIKEEFTRRNITTDPLLAHSYERVMPGLHYIDSIENYWRVCSGINEESKTRVVNFLNEVINTKEYPLVVMDKPIESETAKIVENSYRATILAFLDEWSLFAEQHDIDLTKVIKAIKVRPTHSNIMFPGPGIGGYCLPKDGALGIWAYRNIFHEKNNIFKITTAAININDTRAIHVVDLLQDAFKEVNKEIEGSLIALLGASYREDVSDTRYSGSENIVRKLAEMGAKLSVHDPYVESWPELESNNGNSAFFKNQDELNHLKVKKDLGTVLTGVDAVIIAVRHQPYFNLYPDEIVSKMRIQTRNSHSFHPVIIDCFGILTDSQINRYLELGCVVKGLGRGHIRQQLKNI